MARHDLPKVLNYNKLNRIIAGVLTDKEKEVLHYIGAGIQNQAIAKKLDRTEKDVGFHKENIKYKFGLLSVDQLYKLDFTKLKL